MVCRRRGLGRRFADAWVGRDAGHWDDRCLERYQERGRDFRRWASEAARADVKMELLCLRRDAPAQTRPDVAGVAGRARLAADESAVRERAADLQAFGPTAHRVAADAGPVALLAALSQPERAQRVSVALGWARAELPLELRVWRRLEQRLASVLVPQS
jgi:hypothetical protein